MIKPPASSHANGTVYDVYEKGVPRAVLTIENHDQTRIYSVQKRDVKSNEWSESITTSEDKLSGNETFELWGSLKNLPSQLKQIREVSWGRNIAVAWPDENSIYVRHMELTELVDGKKKTAYFWGLRDGAGFIMDFIITPDNKLIAAVDLPNDICMVMRGYEDFTILKEWSQDGISSPQYGYQFLGKFEVPMSDEVNLTTAVYLPDDGKEDAKYPVVLIRTPYGIHPESGGHTITNLYHYCSRGYALVLQSTRGRCPYDPADWKSEGWWELLVHEPSDGALCLDWITKQPWCNGNIGMQGGSYVAHTQLTAAMSGNPALKCIIPEVCFATVFGDMPYIGGGFQTGLVRYILFASGLKLRPGVTWSEVLRHRPLIDIDKFALGSESPTLRTCLQHPNYDDYWAQDDWFRPEYNIDVPALHISGWYDDDFPGTRANWELMQRNNREHQRLLLGSWKHGYNRHRHLNGFGFGIDSIRPDIWLLKQKWYDRFLRGLDNDVEDKKVEYHVLGDNEWETDSQWPPEEMKFQRWYLHSNGKANVSMTAGTISTEPPVGAEEPDTYQYDPENPPPNWMNFDQLPGYEDVQSFPYDFNDINARHDIAVYTSAPLEEDLTIAGDIMAVLNASCDVLDTDWWVRLEDVDSQGNAMSLSVGMLRARFRNLEDKWFHVFGSNFEKEEMLSGNMSDIVRYEISLRNTAVTFKKGHCIRIAVMNACDNYCFPNSNTGGEEAYVTETVVGTMVVHHSAEHPSYIMLPVVGQ